MLPNYDDFLIKRFEQPDEVRTFEKGKFETVKIGSMTIGRASYEPGWKWSAHVGAATGATLRCGPEICFTSAPATTVGSLAMSRTCRCIFSARNITRSVKQLRRLHL